MPDAGLTGYLPGIPDLRETRLPDTVPKIPAEEAQNTRPAAQYETCLPKTSMYVIYVMHLPVFPPFSFTSTEIAARLCPHRIVVKLFIGDRLLGISYLCSLSY